MAPGTDVSTLALLNEPLRRRLYELAGTAPEGVTRNQASAELGIARSVAAFHLDKLVEAGLLEVDHRRPEGRSGPGAGRPAKWYRRAEVEVSVTVPERRYRLAAEVLAEAADRASDGVPLDDALRGAAVACGRRLGAPGAGASDGSEVDRLVALLTENGYEPRRSDRGIAMTNCPFHALAAGHRDLVCGMNLELLRGLAEAVGLDPDSARLDPTPGGCCVTVAA